MDTKKIKQDIFFYFWLGLILYISTTVLNIIHLYQTKGRDWVDFAFHLVLFSINISIISQLKAIKNWARNLFLLKFIILIIAFYPLILFAGNDGWVYSPHWPHGIFQRICNIGIIVYEVCLSYYLIKRSVRFVFVHMKR